MNTRRSDRIDFVLLCSLDTGGGDGPQSTWISAVRTILTPGLGRPLGLVASFITFLKTPGGFRTFLTGGRLFCLNVPALFATQVTGFTHDCTPC